MKHNYLRIGLYILICLSLVSLGLFNSQPGLAAPLDIYVDDDYTGPDNDGGHDWGVDAFATIQEGINAVEPGGTVHVGPGSYNQALTIAQWLQLDGAGNGINPAVDTIITSPTGSVLTLTAGGSSLTDRMVLSNFRIGSTALNAIYTDSTIGFVSIASVVVDSAANYGIEVHNNAVVTDLLLEDVTFSNNSTGMRVRGQLDGLQITDSLFIDNNYGLQSYAATTEINYLDDVTISATEFISNTSKAMYFEKLSNATFSGLTISDNGTGVASPAGIDINLKYEAYTGITIQDSVFDNNGSGVPAIGGSLLIKARDDSSYSTDPASLTGVLIENNIFTGSPQALRFGEPARNNLGPTGVVILNNHFSSNTTALINETQEDITSTCNSWNDLSGPSYSSNPGGLGEVITHTTTGSIDFAPWLIDSTDDLAGEIGFQLSSVVTVTAGLDTSPADNGFTRINNAVGCAVDGQTINLSGTFYWDYPYAQTAYTNSVSASETADIRGVEIPSGVDNLTITSLSSNALIYGSGDYDANVYDAFIFADDSAAAAGNTNLTVTHLNLDDFEAGVVLGWNSSGVFNGTQVMNNYIYVGGDDYGVQNIAVYFWRGINQFMAINHIYFQGDGTRTEGSGARSFGFQNGTTGGVAYDDLEIGANEFMVLPSSTGIENIYGVWENSHNDVDTVDIRIMNNSFVGRAGDLFDRALLLSSQTSGLDIHGNTFQNVDNVFFSSSSQGHSIGDEFTFGVNTLENVGGADGIFLQNVTNDGTPVHIALIWNPASSIDGETGILGLNELSTSAVHASRPLSAATDIELVTALPMPLNPVFVDDDFAGADRFSDPDGVGAGYGPLAISYNAFDTIQAGVDAVMDGGVVNVLPGEYVENVVLDKPVEIAGTSAADVTVYPAVSNPDCRLGGAGSICTGGGLASNVFFIAAHDVTIHSLTVDGDNPALTSGVVRGGADLDARNGIIHNHTLGSFDNTEVYSTTVRNIYLRGIYVSSNLAEGFHIHDNTVFNVQGEGASIAIMNWASSGIIEDNLVYDANDGIAANHSTGAQYLNNEVINSGSGVHSDNNGSSGGMADVLSGNYVHDCAVNGYGVWVFAPYLDVTVTGNTVENCAVGLTMSGAFGGQTTFSENIVDGQGLAGSTGIYHTTSLWGYGSSDSQTTFTRNTIVNNDYSYYLESNAGYTLTHEAHFNIFVDNPFGADAAGDGTFAVNAENNWWGCNAGPGAAGCDPTTASIDANPWLVLSASAVPEAIHVEETSHFSANLFWNSDDVDTSAINYIPDGRTVTFTGDPLGTLAPLSALTVDAQASSVFTAGLTSGTAVLGVTIDNQTVTDTVIISQPAVTLSSDAYTASEAAGSIIITANLSYTTSHTTTVEYEVLVGTASAADFTPISGTLTFPAGDSQETFSITILEDTIDELDETALIQLSNPWHASLGDPYTATLTIVDNETAPVITLSTAAYSAGEAAGTATITAQLSGTASYPITVDYATSDGTAAAGLDYSAASGTLTFAPETTTASFTVTLLEDTLDEADETVHLALSNPSTSLGTPSEADLTIIDNDPTPTAFFSSTTYSVGESSGSATIEVHLSSQSSFPVTLEYTATAGTASAADFTPASGLITFLPGDTVETFTVSITPDLIDEPDETVNLALGMPDHAGLGTPAAAVLTILDDDATPFVNFALASYTVTENGATAVIEVSLSGQSGYTVQVTAATSDGTATASEDYTSFLGVVEFLPGETSQTFSVTILDDLIDESDETINLALSNPSHAVLGTQVSAVLTITDNETPPTIFFSATAYSTGEGDGTATITVVLSGEASYPITVDYATSNGTAIAGLDYTAASGTLTFAPETTSATFTVSITDDTLDENGETVNLALSNPSTSLGSPSTAILTIIDNDLPPVVAFSSATYSVSEDGASATITVNLSTPSALTVTVNYATANGTATAGQDYTATSGTLTFNPLDTQETFTVPILDDLLDELSETVILSLSGAVNATPGPDATLTIVDNEGEPEAVFSSAAYSVGEGAGSLLVTVDLTFPSTFQVTVDYATVFGSATASDFTPASGTLTFTPGDTQETFSVTILEDAIDEPDETFTLHLSNPVNASAGPDATATIVDNEATPVVSFSAANYSIDESGATATINVVLSGVSSYVVTVDYNTLDGTATPADYTPAAGTLTFQPGDLEETFTVAITEDLIDELDETVILHLSSPVNASAGPDAILTILDNDDLPVVSFSSGEYSVDETGTSIVITATLSGLSQNTVSVDYTTLEGTATAGLDYSTAAGTLTFTPGETEQSFEVFILDDLIDEPDETVILSLSNPVNCSTGPDATLTILDNETDPLVSFSAAAYEIDETASTATITVTLNGLSAYEVTVVYDASAGTATSDDFVPASGTLTFIPGDNEESFTVALIDDLLDETDETVILSLSDAVHAIPGPDAVLTILDDDDPPAVQFSTAEYSVVEDAGPALITATLSAPSGLEVSVAYTASDGTAGDDDYTPASGILTFAPGETEAAFTVQITADDLVEPNETVLLDLSEPVNASLGDPDAAVLTIVDDESLPELNFSTSEYSISESGGTATITVTLSSSSAFTVTVDYAALEGTATGDDFTPISGTLTFAPGETAATFTVSITGDIWDEDDETIILHLSNPVNASAGPDAVLVILDDDTWFHLYLPIINREWAP